VNIFQSIEIRIYPNQDDSGFRGLNFLQLSIGSV